jgi:hypothetical protein
MTVASSNLDDLEIVEGLDIREEIRAKKPKSS